MMNMYNQFISEKPSEAYHLIRPMPIGSPPPQRQMRFGRVKYINKSKNKVFYDFISLKNSYKAGDKIIVKLDSYFTEPNLKDPFSNALVDTADYEQPDNMNEYMTIVVNNFII